MTKKSSCQGNYHDPSGDVSINMIFENNNKSTVKNKNEGKEEPDYKSAGGHHVDDGFY